MVGLTYLQSVIKHSGDEGLDEEGEKNYSQIFSAFSFYPLPLNGSLWQARTFLIFLLTFFFFFLSSFDACPHHPCKLPCFVWFF